MCSSIAYDVGDFSPDIIDDVTQGVIDGFISNVAHGAINGLINSANSSIRDYRAKYTLCRLEVSIERRGFCWRSTIPNAGELVCEP